MSLKQFHVFFITLAVLCTFSFGVWALFAPSDIVGTWGRVGGFLSAAIGVALVPYGIWFVRKSKNIIT
tara:strand:+ start:10627 stop:10830 length:204 start_codon:yes stop_codon:yes gene_type:complete